MLRAEKRTETPGNRFPTKQIPLGSSFQHFLPTAAALPGQRAASPQGTGCIGQKPGTLTRKGHSSGPRQNRGRSPVSASPSMDIFGLRSGFSPRALRNKTGAAAAGRVWDQGKENGERKKKSESEPDLSFF